MYQAKRKGGARHQIIDRREQRLVDQRASLQRDLASARVAGELRVEYQPIVRTTDREIVGVEGLLRWSHPSHGPISPNTFIPLAEQSGVINELGRWVLEQGCADRRRWIGHRGTSDVALSVNVSAHELMSPDFAASVEHVLAGAGTGPGLITLEVTESVFLNDAERALVVLNDLKDLGLTLALDDFGTGYSSLGYLKEFPVDVVKIDQTFVADLGRDNASHAIVSAVVDLAHALGLTVVAEGVETARQYGEVTTLGCDACQGYYFARPMPPAVLESLLREADAMGSGIGPPLPP
jgi:EAL domain-containing protein (putative c-di-GMP-specific phosphodiesterase class I)